jgi:ATP-dependent DNA helicase RecG
MVGAVLWFPDGTVSTAHRGEFRDGDHAEYTLFERKLHNRRLDDAVLFTTLEPCLVRSPERTPCAKRVFLTRVKTVWIGMEDPDPTVEGRGREYLLEQGVAVERFPDELFREIRDANPEFYQQAVKRSDVAHAVPAEGVTLSSFEKPESRVAVANLDRGALERYRDMKGISEAVDSPEFLAHLAHLGAIHVDDRGRSRPTKFGVVLFGKDPQTLYSMTKVLMKIRHANGRVETPPAFEGPAIALPDRIIDYLRDTLPKVIDRSRGTSRDVDALPYEAVREAVINAIIHRDYEDAYRGVQTHIEVTPETVVVKSAGSPKAPISLEKLQGLTAVPVARNPTLQSAFARVRLAEGQNHGMETFRGLVDGGLPRPTYSFDEPFLTLTLYLTAEAAVSVLPADKLAALNTDERRGWEFLSTRQTTSRPEYQHAMGFSLAKAGRHLKHFVDLGLLEREGAGRATTYRTVR